jgi:hypothetical protein
LTIVRLTKSLKYLNACNQIRNHLGVCKVHQYFHLARFAASTRSHPFSKPVIDGTIAFVNCKKHFQIPIQLQIASSFSLSPRKFSGFLGKTAVRPIKFDGTNQAKTEMEGASVCGTDAGYEGKPDTTRPEMLKTSAFHLNLTSLAKGNA